MAGGGRDRRERQDAYNRAVTAQQQVQQVDPLEAQHRANQQAYMTWRNSDGRDVRDAPGLRDHIQIGEGALRRADQERHGTGAMKLAGEAGNAGKLKELRKAQMGREFGASLESALAGRHAEATGSVMPLANLTLSRNQAYAGGMANIYGMRSAQPRPKSWWQYLQEGAQFASNLGQTAMGAMGGG